MIDAIDKSVITHFDYEEYLSGRYSENLISAVKSELQELDESEVLELVGLGFELIEDLNVEHNYKQYIVKFKTKSKELNKKLRRISPRVLLY